MVRDGGGGLEILTGHPSSQDNWTLRSSQCSVWFFGACDVTNGADVIALVRTNRSLRSPTARSEAHGSFARAVDARVATAATGNLLPP